MPYIVFSNVYADTYPSSATCAFLRSLVYTYLFKYIYVIQYMTLKQQSVLIFLMKIMHAEIQQKFMKKNVSILCSHAY